MRNEKAMISGEQEGSFLSFSGVIGTLITPFEKMSYTGCPETTCNRKLDPDVNGFYCSHCMRK